VVPFDQRQAAEKVAQMFREAGVDVTITNEGGVPQDDDGKGLQVSAYV